MTAPEALDLLLKARQATLSRKTATYRAPIDSVENQLAYLIEAIAHHNDRSRLSEINLGLYAVREFEATDEPFANLLHAAAGIARDMQHGAL